jgi:hypothetical protein
VYVLKNTSRCQLGKNYEKVEEKKEKNAKEKGPKKSGICSSKIKINAKGAKNKVKKGALTVFLAS